MCLLCNYYHISKFNSLSSTTTKVEQTVAFSQQSEDVTLNIESMPDSTFLYGCPDDVPLGDFLSRPIKIHEILWNTTPGTFDNTIDPWSLVINDALLKRRLEGFKLLSAKLHVRIVVNGNPFLYGLAIASYFPRPNEFKRPSTTTPAKLCEATMMPYIFLSPTTSEAGEMILPFMCPDNWLDLAGSTVEHMGRLRFITMNALKHSNAASGSVQITVFAWLQDVKLASPTQTNYNIYTHQAGDEYGKGIVSKPASIISKAAGILSNIPIIKPYALSTMMLASNIGKVASVFGFSRPVVVTEIQRFKHLSAGNTANSDQSEAVVKLSFDSKQELSIDPRTVGLGSCDEMTIQSIVTRSAYVATAIWTPSYVDGTVLKKINVNPLLYVPDTSTGPNVTSFMNIPVSTIASMFKYWKGTLRYRFQVVASSLHRGRLRIYYDPIYSTSEPSYNQSYSRIIDLAGQRDFTFDVAWNAHRGWLETNLAYLSPPKVASHINGAAYDAAFCNGEITLTICNALTAPDPTIVQDVYVNIYVSAGDDFQVAAPSDSAMLNLTYQNQSGYVNQSGVEADATLGDAQSPIAQVPAVGNWEPIADPSSHVYMGEVVVSIRNILKRYFYHSIFGAADPAINFWWREYNFPYYPGYTLSTNVSEYRHSGLLGPINVCPTNPIHWLVPCYVGWRGGLRSKFLCPTTGTIHIRRDTPLVGNVSFELNSIGVNNDDNNTKAMWSIFRSGFSGSQIAKSTIDGALEVEFPFYTNQRFAHARRFIHSTVSDTRVHANTHLGMLITGDTNKNFGVSRFVSVGDDFSLFFWIGQPLLFYGDMVWVAASGDVLPSNDL